MRILCLIMVGAFLLTIAIAENSDSQRVNSKPQASMAAVRSLSRSMNVPWSLRRSSENGPAYGSPSNNAMPDNVASPAISVPQYMHKSTTPADGSMILEPMHQYRSTTPNWMKWIPDFFDDDPPPGPGPLIGPIDFPGLSRNLYIRQQPLDEDTNHVVIHVVNRQEKPSYSAVHAGYGQLPLGHNQISYFEKSPSQVSASFYTNPVKSPELDTAQSPYKLVEGNPWQLKTQSSDEKEIKDKKSQYPFFDAPTEISNEKHHISRFSTNSKRAGHLQPGIAWSQRFDGQPIIIDSRGQYRGQHYVRSVDSKAPVKFPAPNATVASAKQEQQLYAPHRKYGYQNNTKVAGENVRSAAAILRAKLTEITAANRRQANRINTPARVSRTSDSSSRQPRHRFSHDDKVNDAPSTTTTTTTTTTSTTTTTTQKSPVYVHDPLELELRTSKVSPRQPRNQLSNYDVISEPPRSPVYIHKPSAPEALGAFEIVEAPDLDNNTDSSTGMKSDDVMQNIMSMTASQEWKNISSNLIDTDRVIVKPAQAMRRVDIVSDDEEHTKEETTTATTSITTTTTTTTVAPPISTTIKTKDDMQNAVEKMMGSFTQWRYKVVSTNFLKDLDGNEANGNKKQR